MWQFLFLQIFFLQQISSKFKQIFYFYKTVHGSACNQVLGDVLVVFAGCLQHCDIVSVHHTRYQKKPCRAQTVDTGYIPVQKEMRSLQTMSDACHSDLSRHMYVSDCNVPGIKKKPCRAQTVDTYFTKVYRH